MRTGRFVQPLGIVAACLAAVGWFAHAAEQPQPEEPSAIVARVVAAAGGEDKLLKLFRIRERLRGSNPESEGNIRISVLEPPKHWWMGNRERVSANGEPATYLVWAWTLGALTDPNSQLALLPEVVENDRPAIGLRVSGTIDPPMDIYFDAADSRLAWIDWRGSIHRFSDWQEHDGARYPAQCIGYRKNSGKPWYFSEILELTRLDTLPDEYQRPSTD
jgi:hypothetical protein